MTDATLIMQVPCQQYETVLSKSRNMIGETLVASGLTMFGENIRIYSNPISNTFSVYLVLPSKQACLISAGTDLHAIVQGNGL